MTSHAKAGGKATKKKEGKREHRESSSELQNEDDEHKPWRSVSRPSNADPVQDASFTMEDESIAQVVETFMYSFTVTDPQQPGNPLVFVSPGFEQLTGYQSEEALCQNCKFLQGHKPEKGVLNQLVSGIVEKRFTSVELANYRKDGKLFHNLLSIIPVLDHNGNVLKFVGVQCDLDDKRKREHVDEHYTTRWQEQVKHYLSAFMVTDASQEHAPVLQISTGFTALTGYEPDDIIDCSSLCLTGAETNVKTKKKFCISHQKNKPGAVKLLYYKKDGTPFWAYVFNCPLISDSLVTTTNHHLCVIMDITTTRHKRIGKFIMGKVVGTGASGTVRKGKNTQTEEIVAVKTVDASKFRSISDIEQMEEEMRVLATLKHPYIIRLFEVTYANNTFYLVMEYASGGSLVKYIYNHGKGFLEEPEARRIFQQITSAVDYCHRRRVIHRDLKPENILMDENNNVKIADFGLAAVTAPFSGGLTLQCGTPEFTAPEITVGKEYDGPTIDIWSMGVILYEALTGKLPFQGTSSALLFKAIQRGVYEPLPANISADCKDLVRKMLTVDPAARITMEEILKHPWCRGVPSEGDPGVASPTALDNDDEASPFSNFTPDGDLGRPGSASSAGGAPESAYSNSNSGRMLSHVHDSVRLVIPVDVVDRDDPITAAILRGQSKIIASHSDSSKMASPHESVLPDDHDLDTAPNSVAATPNGNGAGNGAAGGPYSPSPRTLSHNNSQHVHNNSTHGNSSPMRDPRGNTPTSRNNRDLTPNKHSEKPAPRTALYRSRQQLPPLSPQMPGAINTERAGRTSGEPKDRHKSPGKEKLKAVYDVVSGQRPGKVRSLPPITDKIRTKTYYHERT